MPKSSSYSNDSTITGTDKVLGTDVVGDTTKNYLMSGIADFVESENDLVSNAGTSTDNYVVIFDGATGKIIKVPDATVSFANQDATGLTGLTISRSASGTALTVTDTGTGNAMTINKSNSGEALDVATGSVRVQALTASRYLYLDINKRLSIKTVTEVLSDIGAFAANGSVPLTGGVTGDQDARLYRPFDEIAITSSGSVSTICTSPNTIYTVDTSGGNISITLSDADVTSDVISTGYEWEYFITDATNALEFGVTGSQTLTGTTSYNSTGWVKLKYLGSNSWIVG